MIIRDTRNARRHYEVAAGRSGADPVNGYGPLRIVDFNNFFSASGGGTKTYHLEKLDYFDRHPGVQYSLIVPSDSDRVEQRGSSRIYHLEAPAVKNTMPPPGKPRMSILAVLMVAPLGMRM